MRTTRTMLIKRTMRTMRTMRIRRTTSRKWTKWTMRMMRIKKTLTTLRKMRTMRTRRITRMDNEVRLMQEFNLMNIKKTCLVFIHTSYRGRYQCSEVIKYRSVYL